RTLAGGVQQVVRSHGESKATTTQQQNRSATVLRPFRERLCSNRQAERPYSLTRGRAGGSRCGGRGAGVAGRVDPAAVNPPAEGLGRLGIGTSLPHQAAESRLDMAGWATKTVVQIEVTERGIEIVAPEQAHHPPA